MAVKKSGRPGIGAALIWNVSEKWSNRILTTAIFVILGRLLGPADFGVVAFAAAITALFQAIVMQGFARPLVREKEVDRNLASVSFVFSAVLSICLAALVYILAPVVSSGLSEGVSPEYLRALALVIIFGGLGSVPLALLQRDLKFKSLAIRRLVASLAGASLGIPMALLGAGAWSLVAQSLAVEFVGLVLLWVSARWLPGVPRWTTGARRLVRNSIKSAGVEVLDGANNNGDNIVVGHLLGPIALGFYAVGYRLYSVMLQVTVQSVSAVSLPAFSRQHREGHESRDAFLRCVLFSAVVCSPIYSTMAVTSNFSVPLLFGSQWVESSQILTALMPAALLVSLVVFDRSVLMAHDKFSVTLKISALSTIVNLTLFVVGAYSFGIVGVALALAVGHACLLPIRLVIMRRLLGFSIRDYLVRAGVPVGFAALMYLTMLGTQMLLGSRTEVWSVVASVAAGGAFYVICISLFCPPATSEFRKLIKRRKARA